MAGTQYIGWDIGGAHLKVARVDADGKVLDARQYPTPLWQGVQSLEETLRGAVAGFNGARVQHAVTMTAELVDVFETRKRGVAAILDILEHSVAPESAAVYTVSGEFIPPAQARQQPERVASANWRATAQVAAERLGDGVLVDVGSTTTDVIPFVDSRVSGAGRSDQERLRSEELVYTGVVRTPVMALVRRAPFAGVWQNVAADLFATMADVYRVTGDLDEAADQMTPADGAGKERNSSIRRLARMLGMDDAGSGREATWNNFAAYVADRQYRVIHQSFRRVVSEMECRTPVTLAGAGSGRFIARRLAQQHDLSYRDFDELVEVPAALKSLSSVCATAISVAQLARGVLA